VRAGRGGEVHFRRDAEVDGGGGPGRTRDEATEEERGGVSYCSRGRIRGRKSAHLQGRLRLHLVHQRVRDALVELRAVNAAPHLYPRPRTWESTFIASCGVIAPDVISSSSESVSAIPSLRARQRASYEGERAHVEPR
jgi:hypothetical protein